MRPQPIADEDVRIWLDDLSTSPPEHWKAVWRLSRATCRWSNSFAIRHARRFPPGSFRLVPRTTRSIEGGGLEFAVSRVLSATIAVAHDPDRGWAVRVPGNPPPAPPDRLEGVRPGIETVKALADEVIGRAASARRLRVVQRGDDGIPLCLEAGFATNRERLWSVFAGPEPDAGDDRRGNIKILGCEWPIMISVDAGRPSWLVTNIRPAGLKESARVLGSWSSSAATVETTAGARSAPVEPL